MELKDLIEQEELHLIKLNELVQESIKEEEILSSKLIELEKDTDLTFAQRCADKVAELGGSWYFIFIFFGVLTFWICINSNVFFDNVFDPYPFILLNLVLSCLAAIQAPIIMMSQNRQEEKDRRRGRSDYMINLKAEMEIRSLHSKIDLLMAQQMKSLFVIQQAQMESLQKIEKHLLNT